MRFETLEAIHESEMRGILALTLLGFLSVILQTTFFRIFSIPFLKVDLVLLIVLYAGFYRSTMQASLLSFFLGYCLDVFSGQLMGVFSFTKVAVSFSAALLSRKVYLNNIFLQILIFFLFSLYEAFLVISIMLVFGYPLPTVSLLPNLIIKRSILLALLGPAAFHYLKKAERLAEGVFKTSSSRR